MSELLQQTPVLECPFTSSFCSNMLDYECKQTDHKEGQQKEEKKYISQELV